MSTKILWDYNKLRNELYYYLSFIIWPFGVTFFSLKHWRSSWSKNLLWIFCIYFGYTFIIAKDVIGGADSARYAQLFSLYAYSEMSFRELMASILSENSGYVDILHPIITFLVSRLTHNPSILFAVFGLIFGYFYSRNIWYILDHINGKITPVILFYLFTFTLINPIWNINGFRMWTAAQIFFYGVLPYLLEGKTNKLIWSGLSVFMHFSFASMLAILVIYIIFKNRINFYFVFFILTSFIKELDLQGVRSALSFLPGVFQSKMTAYTNTDYAQLIITNMQEYNWYVIYASKAIGWVIYALVLYTYFFCRKFLSENKVLMTLFCFSIFTYSCANIFNLVPSGGRFLVLASSFVFAFLIIFLSSIPKIRGLQLILMSSIPFLLLFCVVNLREGMDFYGLSTIIGNPFNAFLNPDPDPVPLINVFKQLF